MILKNILILFLSLSLVNNSFAFSGEHSQSIKTIEDIKKTYPNAEIKTVSLNTFNKFKTKLANNNLIDETPPLKASVINDECAYYKVMYSSSNTESKSILPLKINNPSPAFNVESTYSSGKDKDFLIVLAVVGVIVVASLVIYTGTYLYRAFENSIECPAWTEYGFRHSSINDDNETQVRKGHLNGLYFSKGYFIPIGVMGFTLEAGQFLIDLKLNSQLQTQSFSGPYLLFGPTFTFPITHLNKIYFSIELLGGTTSEPQIGLMSTLRLSLGFNVTENIGLSLGTGAAFIKMKSLESYLGHYDDLNFLTGIKTTLRF